MRKVFLNFLNSLKTSHNASLIEAITDGYIACFEAIVRYQGIDRFTNKLKQYTIVDEIPLEDFNEQEALRQIIEEWRKKGSDLVSDEHLRFLISKRPQALIAKNRINLLNHDAWNTLRNSAKAIFGKRIEEMTKLKGAQERLSRENLLRLRKRRAETSDISGIVKESEKIKSEKMAERMKGLKAFARRELAPVPA